jgi:hypothetical protein
MQICYNCRDTIVETIPRTMKYLDDIEIRTLINLGKTLELFLGRSVDDKEVINWISLAKGTNEKIDVSVYSVFDEGDLDNLDIYSFTPVDPDEFFATWKFPSLDEAVTFIRDNYKLTDLKFVNQGVTQQEYKRLKEKDNE